MFENIFNSDSMTQIFPKHLLAIENEEILNVENSVLKIKNCIKNLTYTHKNNRKNYDLTKSTEKFLLPPPFDKEQKKMTKWEKFAERKGIKKRKNEDRLVYCEEQKKFIRRFGKNSAVEMKYKKLISDEKFTQSQLKKMRRKNIENNLKNKLKNRKK